MQNAAPSLENTLKQYQQALLINPKNIEAQIHCGNLCVELKRFEEAAGYFRRIVRILKNNQAARDALCFALQELGNDAHQKGRFALAAACFEEATGYQPQNAVFWYNMGNAQRELGQYPAALASFKQSIKLNPNDADAHNNCGNVQRELGQLDQAIASYKQALQINPNLHHALAHLVHQKQHICDWQDIESQIKQLRDWVNTKASTQISPFAFLAMPNTSAAEQALCASLWASHLFRQFASQKLAFNFENTPPKKLKIGYLSADFRLHPLAFLITELIENTDKSQFETIAYSYGINDKSPARKRLENAFYRFNDIRQLSDTEAAKKIHDDGIAILVDLTGFTQSSRTSIVALKPAPICVNWLGYPGTMGKNVGKNVGKNMSSAMGNTMGNIVDENKANQQPLFDYLLADKTIAPNAADFCEELLYLPCYQPNNSQRPLGNAGQKIAHHLPENAFVYCCFNQSFKITADVFARWMHIMQQVPNSVLWLLDSNIWATRNLQIAAETAGIDKARLVFAPRVPIAEHLARHVHADLFLDTAPYNAHTTASDALFMGLPLLTCMGETFASRVAASLLQRVDLPELITNNWQTYVEQAVNFGQNPAVMQQLKQKLQLQIKESSLFKPAQFVSDLEVLYKQIWQAYVHKTTKNP